MIESLPVESILNTALAKGGDFAEIFVESSLYTNIVCDDNRLERIAASNDTGLGLRLLHDTKTAFGSSNDLSKDELIRLASSVSTAAQKQVHPRLIPPIPKICQSQRQIVKNHPAGISLEKKRRLVERANQIARGASEHVVQVKVILRDQIRRIWIVSSDDTNISDEQVYVALIVQVVCAEGDLLQMSFESIGGTRGYEIFDETTPEEIAAIAAKRANLMLSAAPAPTGPMPVVLASDAGGTMIHEAVGHGLEADLATEGLSVYRDQLGRSVASPLISVFDDATLNGNRGSYTYDDEGTPAHRTMLIDGGVLNTYLQNRITSARCDVPSTGNGRRQSYAHPPLVRMSNTLIAPGSSDPDEIIRATERGLYVKKIGGGQVNTVNGDFVFDVQEGYRIEGGKIGEPVRGATLTGNGPKILETIDKVGSDLGFSIGTCGKNGQEIPVSCGQPTIRIPELIVGGTA